MSLRGLRTLFLPGLFAVLLCAQNERGNITGVVTDPSGAAIPGAGVALTNRATNQADHVVSTSVGDYNAPNLRPGIYRIEVTAQGFKRFVQDNVTLTAAGTVRVDAVLQVGQVNETVEVTGSAVTRRSGPEGGMGPNAATPSGQKSPLVTP